jgi:hypothetical protein
MEELSTYQVITQAKLAELQIQRGRLIEKYDALVQRIEDLDNRWKLRALLQGLAEIRVADRRLHPELPQLDAYLSGPGVSGKTISFWLDRLRREVDKGRNRAEVVCFFGAALDSWSQARAISDYWKNTEFEQQAVLLQRLSAPVDSLPRLNLLRKSIVLSQSDLEKIVRRFKELLSIQSQSTQSSIDLNAIASNPHFTKKTRLEARRYEKDEVMGSQLRQSVGVLSRDPEDWRWPPMGITSRAIWARTKWRLYLDQSLIEFSKLQEVASFWTNVCDSEFTTSQSIASRRSRLSKLRELNAPMVILANEERMLAALESKIRFNWIEPTDPWSGTDFTSETSHYGGIVAMRAERLSKIHSTTPLNYAYRQGANAVAHLLHAEIQLLRSAKPDATVFVLKLDIAYFFASVPHATLLCMLETLGAPPECLSFAKRFLSVPCLDRNGSLAPAVRGVPMEQGFSHWLCERLMQCMEKAIYAQSQVRIIRTIDDICILAKEETQIRAAYQSVVEFLDDVGLSLNESKTGLSVVQSNRPVGWTESRAKFGMLELVDGGEWTVHRPSLNEFIESVRVEVTNRTNVFEKVRVMNESLDYLMSSLGFACPMGDSHRRAINESLDEVAANFFGEGISLEQGFRDTIQEHLKVDMASVPTGWFYWPVSAGGLGMRSLAIVTGQYNEGYTRWKQQQQPKPEKRGKNWQTNSTQWRDYYKWLLMPLEAIECIENDEMKRLTEGFISRGQSISDGGQTELSSYWKWVLNVHGPEIIEMFGTYDFLLKELLPIQLIREFFVNDPE